MKTLQPLETREQRDKIRKRLRKEVALGFPSASRFKCQHCLEQASEWHHVSYQRWNDIIPLCRECHIAIHKAR